MIERLEALILERSAGQGPDALRTDVDDMRRRLIREAQREARRSVKLGEGGLFDIHFIIEFLQLRHAVRNPPDKDTIRLLTHLNRNGHLNDVQLQVLYESYLFFRALDHEIRLIHGHALASLPDDPGRLAEIGLAFEGAPAEPAARGAWIKELFGRHAAAVHRVYLEVLGP